MKETTLELEARVQKLEAMYSAIQLSGKAFGYLKRN